MSNFILFHHDAVPQSRHPPRILSLGSQHSNPVRISATLSSFTLNLLMPSFFIVETREFWLGRHPVYCVLMVRTTHSSQYFTYRLVDYRCKGFVVLHSPIVLIVNMSCRYCHGADDVMNECNGCDDVICGTCDQCGGQESIHCRSCQDYYCINCVNDRDGTMCDQCAQHVKREWERMLENVCEWMKEKKDWEISIPRTQSRLPRRFSTEKQCGWTLFKRWMGL